MNPWTPSGPASRMVAGLTLAATLSSCASLAAVVRAQPSDAVRYTVEERPTGYRIEVIPPAGDAALPLPDWLLGTLPVVSAWVGGNALMGGLVWGHVLDAAAGGVLGGVGLLALDLLGERLVGAWRVRQSTPVMPAEAWLEGSLGWKARPFEPTTAGRFVAEIPMYPHEAVEDMKLWMGREDAPLAGRALRRRSPLNPRDPLRLPGLTLAPTSRQASEGEGALKIEADGWYLDVDSGASVTLDLLVGNAGVGPASDVDLAIEPVLSGPHRDWLVAWPQRLQSLPSGSTHRLSLKFQIPGYAAAGAFQYRLRAHEVAGVSSAPVDLRVRVRASLPDRVQMAMPMLDGQPVLQQPSGQIVCGFRMGLVAPEMLQVSDLDFRVRSRDPRILILDASGGPMPTELAAGKNMVFRGTLVAAPDVSLEEPVLLDVKWSLKRDSQVVTREEQVELSLAD